MTSNAALIDVVSLVEYQHIHVFIVKIRHIGHLGKG